MKVYIATHGEREDREIVGVFLTLADAEDCGLADDVEEHDLLEGPMDVRTRHQVWITRHGPRAGLTSSSSWREQYDGNDEVVFPSATVALGWDLDQTRDALLARVAEDNPDPFA